VPTQLEASEIPFASLHQPVRILVKLPGRLLGGIVSIGSLDPIQLVARVRGEPDIYIEVRSWWAQAR
jgi:hypothetical protein